MGELEIELISNIKNRSPNAFDCLINTYTRPVYYLAYNILNVGFSKEDIEECVSDVFVEAWQKIDEYDDQKGSLRGWLLMLTKYRALTYKRKLGKHNVNYLEDYGKAQGEIRDKASPILEREAQLMLMQVVDGFGETDRLLFVRRYLMGESIVALMDSTGLSRSAVDNRLARCRNKIKEVLFYG